MTLWAIDVIARSRHTEDLVSLRMLIESGRLGDNETVRNVLSRGVADASAASHRCGRSAVAEERSGRICRNGASPCGLALDRSLELRRRPASQGRLDVGPEACTRLSFLDPARTRSRGCHGAVLHVRASRAPQTLRSESRGQTRHPIVSDAYLDRRRSFNYLDHTARSVTVLDRIGQRLLDDPVHRDLELLVCTLSCLPALVGELDGSRRRSFRWCPPVLRAPRSPPSLRARRGLEGGVL